MENVRIYLIIDLFKKIVKKCALKFFIHIGEGKSCWQIVSNFSFEIRLSKSRKYLNTSFSMALNSAIESRFVVDVRLRS